MRRYRIAVFFDKFLAGKFRVDFFVGALFNEGLGFFVGALRFEGLGFFLVGALRLDSGEGRGFLAFVLRALWLPVGLFLLVGALRFESASTCRFRCFKSWGPDRPSTK